MSPLFRDRPLRPRFVVQVRALGHTGVLEPGPGHVSFHGRPDVEARIATEAQGIEGVDLGHNVCSLIDFLVVAVRSVDTLACEQFIVSFTI